jgi:hypothetical protein
VTFHERALVLRPGEGRAVSVLGDRYTYKATGEQTGGAYGLVETTVPAGSSGPPPHVYPFSNRTDREARLLTIISPAGFEQAFAEMAEVAPSAGEPPDMDRLMEIARKYNLQIVGPPPA